MCFVLWGVSFVVVLVYVRIWYIACVLDKTSGCQVNWSNWELLNTALKKSGASLGIY